MSTKKINFWEPYFFIVFGIFHLHRVWALIDRNGYSNFWLKILNNKGILYFAIMGILSFLCILGIITFIKNLNHNYWWRWIYVFGGSYVLFDLFAIAIDLKIWEKLILLMFNTEAFYWNILWWGFIVLGMLAFILGIIIFDNRYRINSQA